MPSFSRCRFPPRALVAALALSAATLGHAEPAATAPAAATTVAPTIAVAANAAPAEAPARAVSWRHPRSETWPETVEARGNVMPWQELRVATEIGGLRLAGVIAGVGDRVKKGQTLAQLDTTTIETDIESAKGQLAETEAALAQAVATLERARRLAPSGGVSQQELTLYETQKQTADARVRVARAQEKRQELRLQHATIVAPDDGLISSSTAAEGAIVQAGSELFRLIRQGRLEWRAEIKGELLIKLAKGQEAAIERGVGPDVPGKVRLVSPTIDLTTRHGLAYVELPADTNLKAGLNVAGRIAVGKRKLLAVPASAVLRRNDAAQVLIVDGDDRLRAVDVTVGETRNDWVEITGNVDERSRVVTKAADDLQEGEPVRAVADKR